MSLLRSSGVADPHDSIYGAGACHIHAMACALVHETEPPRFLVIEDHEERVWESDADPDDYLPAIVHVYSLHVTDTGRVARDVIGDRLADKAEGEADWLFSIGAVVSREVGLAELLDLTEGRESDAVRESGGSNPLCEVREDDIRAAMTEDTVAADIPQISSSLEVSP